MVQSIPATIIHYNETLLLFTYENTFLLVHCDRMQSRIDLTWFISGNDHVNVCANYQSDWSTFVSDFGEELFLDLENAYSSKGCQNHGFTKGA